MMPFERTSLSFEKTIPMRSFCTTTIRFSKKFHHKIIRFSKIFESKIIRFSKNSLAVRLFKASGLQIRKNKVKLSTELLHPKPTPDCR